MGDAGVEEPQKKRVKRCGGVILEGLASGHEHVGDMGVYEALDRVVSGRGVWRRVGHRDAFLYYSDQGSWCVSDEDDMASGAHQGSLMVESDATTPQIVEETWNVHDSEEWVVDAPNVRCRACAPEDVDAAIDARDRQRAEAAEAAAAAPEICLSGLDADDEYGDSVGTYDVVDGARVNGKGVWRLREEDDDDGTYLYYASSNEWFVSLQENADVGAPTGWLKSKPTDALTPDAAPDTWAIYDVETQAWSDVPLAVKAATAAR